MILIRGREDFGEALALGLGRGDAEQARHHLAHILLGVLGGAFVTLSHRRSEGEKRNVTATVALAPVVLEAAMLIIVTTVVGRDEHVCLSRVRRTRLQMLPREYRQRIHDLDMTKISGPGAVVPGEIDL
jgi:hypothetical protein